jgi:hypothetical protein
LHLRRRDGREELTQKRRWPRQHGTGECSSTSPTLTSTASSCRPHRRRIPRRACPTCVGCLASVCLSHPLASHATAFFMPRTLGPGPRPCPPNTFDENSVPCKQVPSLGESGLERGGHTCCSQPWSRLSAVTAPLSHRFLRTRRDAHGLLFSQRKASPLERSEGRGGRGKLWSLVGGRGVSGGRTAAAISQRNIFSGVSPWS